MWWAWHSPAGQCLPVVQQCPQSAGSGRGPSARTGRHPRQGHPPWLLRLPSRRWQVQLKCHLYLKISCSGWLPGGAGRRKSLSGGRWFLLELPSCSEEAWGLTGAAWEGYPMSLRGPQQLLQRSRASRGFQSHFLPVSKGGGCFLVLVFGTGCHGTWRPEAGSVALTVLLSIHCSGFCCVSKGRVTEKERKSENERERESRIFPLLTYF